LSLIKQPKARLIILTAMLGIFAFTLVPRCYSIWKLHLQKEALEQKKQQAMQLNQELQAEKDKLNDPLVFERIAREQLGMVKKGEKVLVKIEMDAP
jgi:cell division protein FtsB